MPDLLKYSHLHFIEDTINGVIQTIYDICYNVTCNIYFMHYTLIMEALLVLSILLLSDLDMTNDILITDILFENISLTFYEEKLDISPGLPLES